MLVREKFFPPPNSAPGLRRWKPATDTNLGQWYFTFNCVSCFLREDVSMGCI